MISILLFFESFFVCFWKRHWKLIIPSFLRGENEKKEKTATERVGHIRGGEEEGHSVTNFAQTLGSAYHLISKYFDSHSHTVDETKK